MKCYKDGLRKQKNLKNSGFTLPEIVLGLVLIILVTTGLAVTVGGYYNVASPIQQKALLSHMNQVRSEMITMKETMGSAPLTAAGMIRKNEFTGTTEAMTITLKTTVTLSPSSQPTVSLNIITVAPKKLNLHQFGPNNLISEFIPSNISSDYLVGSGTDSYFDLDEIMRGKRGYIKSFGPMLFYVIGPFPGSSADRNRSEGDWGRPRTNLIEIIRRCNDISQPAPGEFGRDFYNYVWRAFHATHTDRNEDSPLHARIHPGRCYYYHNKDENSDDHRAFGVYTPPGKISLAYLLLLNPGVDEHELPDWFSGKYDSPAVSYYGIQRDF